MPQLRIVSTGIDLAKRLIGQLPATNALAAQPRHRRLPPRRRCGHWSTCCCIGRDRAYRVAEIAELVEGAGLEIVSFINPWRYDPDSYLSDAG